MTERYECPDCELRMVMEDAEGMFCLNEECGFTLICRTAGGYVIDEWAETAARHIRLESRTMNTEVEA